MPLKAQVGQDRYVLEALLRRAGASGDGPELGPGAPNHLPADDPAAGGLYKTNGTFVDVGAHDGVTLSNSYALEVGLGWRGVCVEPLEEVFEALVQARACAAVRAAAFNSSGTVKFQRLSGKAEMLSGIVGALRLWGVGCGWVVVGLGRGGATVCVRLRW